MSGGRFGVWKPL